MALIFCTVDTVTGGDNRWFEIAMRRQAKSMQIDALQAWAETQLSSPERIAVLEEKGLTSEQLPQQFQRLPYHYYPMYRAKFAGGPFIQVGTGGWDMGWGYIVGRVDLESPNPVVANSPGWHWVKKIKPGVFVYAFDV